MRLQYIIRHGLKGIQDSGARMARIAYDSDEKIWEWRMFCPVGPASAVAQSIFERLGGRDDTLVTDRYVLVNGLRHNMKARKNDLQVKEFVEEHNGFQLFRRKQSHAFPLKAGQVKNILKLGEKGAGNGDVSDYGDVADLIQGLRQEGHRVQCVEVEKRRQHFIDDDDDIVTEAAVLTVDFRRYWSISFEGRNLERLKGYTPELPDGDVIVGGYIDFFCEIGLHR